MYNKENYQQSIKRIMFLIISILLINIPNIVHAIPANESFNDEDFYKCIVDNYNKQTSSSYDYTVKLTDDELSSIKTLTCYGSDYPSDDYVKYDISDVTGIEKLTNLQRLILYCQNITNINLRQNLSLTYLNLNFNLLEELDLSLNKSLTYLSADSNKLTTLDLRNNNLLDTISLDTNKLTELNLGVNNNLKKLYISNNNLKFIDLKNFPSLERLSLFPGIKTLDLSSNTKLKYLFIPSGEFETLDLSNNKLITDLDISSSELTSLDLKNNIELKRVKIKGNKLSSLNLSNNVKLEELYIAGNSIENIDLSNNTILKTLQMNLSENFKYLSLYKNSSLKNLELGIPSKETILKISLNKNINVKLYDEIYGETVHTKYLNIVDTTNKNIININETSFDVIEDGETILTLDNGNKVKLIVGKDINDSDETDTNPKDENNNIDENNEEIVNVPDTFSRYSIILILTGVAFVIIGIVIILYVYVKNKKIAKNKHQNNDVKQKKEGM